MEQEKEAEIFYPEPVKIKVGDREYLLQPLKLKQMRLLIKLSKLDIKSISIDMIDNLTDSISQLLKEPDKDFLEENLDVTLIKDIFLKVRSLTYAGMPAQEGAAPKGKAPSAES